jgi:hypothetical protein
MIPTTYYSPRLKNTFEVQVIDVQPQWACSTLGHTHRVLIGVWNFNCEYFLDVGQGSSTSPEKAFELAVKDVERCNVEIHEDEMMMGFKN